MADDSVPDDDNLNCNGASFECGYVGGVHYSLPDSNSDSEFGGSDIQGWDSESESGESVVELEGDELDISLTQLRDEIEALAEWLLFVSVQSAYGNIVCTGGWRLTGRVLRRRKLNYGSGSSAQRSINLIDAFRRL